MVALFIKEATLLKFPIEVSVLTGAQSISTDSVVILHISLVYNVHKVRHTLSGHNMYRRHILHGQQDRRFFNKFAPAIDHKY